MSLDEAEAFVKSVALLRVAHAFEQTGTYNVKAGAAASR
jgi:hypothetical protein